MNYYFILFSYPSSQDLLFSVDTVFDLFFFLGGHSWWLFTVSFIANGRDVGMEHTVTIDEILVIDAAGKNQQRSIYFIE